MARLQDLSNELVLGILEEVSPEDIVSISLASKSIYQLAVPRLEKHRSLQKQYTNFRNMVEHEPNSWHDPGGLLADLLCKIVTDAEIGHYVRKIELDMCNNDGEDGWESDAFFEKPRQGSKTSMEIIEEAVRAVWLIPTDEADDWLYEIRRGNEDPLVALLLLCAPKLHTLKLAIPYTLSESYLFNTIQRVERQGCNANISPSHLKNVELSFAEWNSLDFVKAFMSLPSLESIKTDYLSMYAQTHELSSTILRQPSNVKYISFRSGCVPGEAISELLRGVKNLRAFVYDFQPLWRSEEYSPTFDCFDMLCSLEANASHTLEHLVLRARDIKTSQIAPLREFHVLREVDIQTSGCFAVNDGGPANLIGLLPISLERLIMCWYETTSDDGVETLTEAILGLVRESKTQLPHLRMLHVSTTDQGAYSALWDCLASDKTAQINPMLSFKIQGPAGEGEISAWAANVCTCGQDCFGNGSKWTAESVSCLWTKESTSY